MKLIKLYSLIRKNKHISSLDITLFFQQFASLFSAGIPLMKCFDILAKSNSTLSHIILTIKHDILSGKNLYTSLRRHPTYFDELTCQLIKIGEHTGKLNELLLSIANNHAKATAFRNQIKQALLYPCFIMSTAIIITFIMFIFIIPKFAELFQQTENKLPALTLFLFSFANALNRYLPIIMLIFIVIFISIKKINHTYTFKHVIKSAPIIKPCLHTILLIRFTRHLAITLSAGIPIIDALTLSANACDDLAFFQTHIFIRNKVASGIQIHQALASIAHIPAFITQMVRIGEESGKLADMLANCADLLEAQLNRNLKQLSQLLEPLIMLVLGALIGGMVIGMYLPIFNLGKAF